MKCPHCDVLTNSITFDKFNAYKCPICFNLIINKSELIKYNSRFRELFDELKDIQISSMKGPDYEDYFTDGTETAIKFSQRNDCKCRKCNSKMQKIILMDKNKITFDFCPLCDSVYISKDNFQEMISSIHKLNFGIKRIIKHKLIFKIPFLRNLIYPVFNEMTLYLTSLSSIYVIFSDKKIRDVIFMDLRFVIIFTFGILLSLFHVFSNRPKGTLTRTIMLLYIVLLNIIVSIDAFTFLLEKQDIWLTIIPGWNVISSFITLILMRADVVDERSISNDNATMTEVIIGSISLLLIILFMNKGNMHWSLTLSFCVFYSINLQNAIVALINSIKKYCTL